MQSIVAGFLATLFVSAPAQPATEPVVKTTTIRAGHDIAPLPGGKVAPISQSDKDNVNNALDYFEKKLRPSRRGKNSKTEGAPKAVNAPTSVSAPTSK